MALQKYRQYIVFYGENNHHENPYFMTGALSSALNDSKGYVKV